MPGSVGIFGKIRARIGRAIQVAEQNPVLMIVLRERGNRENGKQ
jgi:hypothetical protein